MWNSEKTYRSANKQKNSELNQKILTINDACTHPMTWFLIYEANPSLLWCMSWKLQSQPAPSSSCSQQGKWVHRLDCSKPLTSKIVKHYLLCLNHLYIQNDFKSAHLKLPCICVKTLTDNKQTFSHTFLLEPSLLESFKSTERFLETENDIVCHFKMTSHIKVLVTFKKYSCMSYSMKEVHVLRYIWSMHTY